MHPRSPLGSLSMWMSTANREACDDGLQTQRYKGAPSTHKVRGWLHKTAEQPQNAKGNSIKTDDDQVSNPVLGRGEAIICLKKQLSILTAPTLQSPRGGSRLQRSCDRASQKVGVLPPEDFLLVNSPVDSGIGRP